MTKRQSVRATTEEIETAEKAAFSAAKKITAFLAKDPTVPDDAKGVAAAVKALNSYVRLVNREMRLKVSILAAKRITTNKKGGA